MSYIVDKINYVEGVSMYQSQFINILFLTQFPQFQRARTSNMIAFARG